MPFSVYCTSIVHIKHTLNGQYIARRQNNLRFCWNNLDFASLFYGRRARRVFGRYFVRTKARHRAENGKKDDPDEVARKTKGVFLPFSVYSRATERRQHCCSRIRINRYRSSFSRKRAGKNRYGGEKEQRKRNRLNLLK